MAKKDRTQGTFKTAGPAPVDNSGVSVRDILAFAAGKNNGEELNPEDIDRIISEKGISQRDARRIRKGSQQFFNSGMDYRMTGQGRYNVNSPNAGETKASRKAGNKAGFNPGDLVKLGRNVSTLVGLADMHSADYAKSKESKPWEDTSDSQPIGTGRKKFDEMKFSWEGQGGGEGGNEGTKGRAPKTFTVPKVGVSDLISKGGGKSAKGEAFVEGRSATTSVAPKKDERGFWSTLALGDIPLLWDKQNYKDLGTTYNPAQLWSEEAREKGRALGRQKAAEEMAGEGYNVQVDDKGKIVSMSKPASENWYGNSPAEEYFMKDGKLVDKTGKEYRKIQTIGMPNMGLLTPTPGKVTPNIKAPQFMKSAGKKGKEIIKKGFEKVSSATKSGLNPSVAGTGLPNPSSAVSMKQAQGMMKEVQGMKLDRAVKENWLKKMSDYIKANKDKLQGVDDAETASYNLDGFKKGGKLPSYGPGGGLYPKATLGLTPEQQSLVNKPIGKFNAYPVNTSLTMPQYKGSLNVGRKNAADLNADVESAMISPSTMSSPGNSPGDFLARKPQVETENPFKEGSIVGDVAGKAAKYALPFIGEGLARKELNKIKPAEFKTANFMTGAVRDLPRPNMKLRYREPVGVDVQSEIAGQKFADAQERDAESNYQIQNSMSKLSQMDQILNRTNQGTMFNTQGKNQNSMFNAQLKGQVAGAKAESMKEPFIAAQQHLATDISTGAYLNAGKKSQLAEEILKHEQPGSTRYNQAIKWLGNGKKGMKFKV